MTEATSQPEIPADPAALHREFNDYVAAQARGEFDYKGDPNDAKARAEFEARAFEKFKRAIELTAILRRANTGPAKAKKGTSRKKADSSLSAAEIEDELLG